MTLTAGTRIGPYEIASVLGAGGMGEVYRAHDTKLGRDVALKVLPELFAADAERVARLVREAQVLAALNHPHVAGIYGFEDSTGVRALVMELVEGPTLAERIALGPIPLDEALAIARQIAQALEAAHEQGIIHRDLKPANIKVRLDGTVKVLDFGLAKAFDPTVSSAMSAMTSPTLSLHATQAGLILGTAAYMAPEQARGKTLDRRADIWGFGCVLFEVLSGQRAFPGEDISDTLATVLKFEPDWNALPSETPPAIRRLLRRCLAKDPQSRLREAGSAILEIDDTLNATPGAEPTIAASGAAPPRRRPWIAIGAAVIVGGAAGAIVWSVMPAPAPASVRFLAHPPEGTTIAVGGRPGAVAAVSPDGSRLAFTARDASGKLLLWVRPIDAFAPHPLAGTEGAAWPFWSPDSRFIVYFADQSLHKISASGGPPQRLCSAVNAGRGGAWSTDGTIVFGSAKGLFRVPAAGGEPVLAAPIASGAAYPWFLPDARHVLYYTAPAGEQAGVYVTSVDGQPVRRLLAADTGAVFDERSGRLLFVRGGTLLAQTFDATTFDLRDDPFPVGDRVEFSAVPGLVAFSVSRTGVLAYGLGASGDAGLQMTWVDRTGKSLGAVGPRAEYRGVELSPDGRRIAAHRHDRDGGDIWITDTVRGTTSRFTFDASQEHASPIWSPDGTQIAFGAVRGGKRGLYRKPADATGAEEELVDADAMVLPVSWSPDGQRLIYWRTSETSEADLAILPLSGDRKPVPLLDTAFRESHAQISPDGRWVAYQSAETGKAEIYVRSFPAGAGKMQISIDGGLFPRWRSDGRELFFMDRATGGRLLAVDVRTTSTGVEAGTPKPLFDTGYNNLPHPNGGFYHTFAVSPDGQRFLIPRPSDSTSSAPALVAVVVNWPDAR